MPDNFALKSNRPAESFLDRLLDPWFYALAQCQHAIHQLTHSFWDERGLCCMNLPLTTNSISSPMGRGSDSLPVKIKLFDVDTYLADSMQFALELGCRINPEGTYYLMPSFRGEQPDETHLCQFFHSEAELPVALDGLIHVVDQYFVHLCRGLLDRCGGLLKEQVGTISHLEQVANLNSSIMRIEFDEAVKLVGDTSDVVTHLACGARVLTRKGENRLMERAHSIVWLTHFDHLSVPFYQAFDPENPKRALAADLLFGIGEVIGAGERHASCAEVAEALQLHEVSASDYEWYLEMKDEAPMKTSGFGMGVERFLMWVFNKDDIREFEVLRRVNGQVNVP